ncbi:MAG: YicC/YloC family endoribonuclease [Gammaproteobacteria bacterium]
MPPIQSMTGFARLEATHPWGSLGCEIRSVNHRYLELQLRVPEPLRHAEHAARERLREVLGRGKVDCTLRLQPASRSQGTLCLDDALLHALSDACSRIDTLAPGLSRPTPLDFLGWPGVIAADTPDTDTTSEAVLALVQATAAELVAMREREGERLAGCLEQRLAGIAALVGEVRERLPQLIGEYRGRLTARISDLGVEADPARISQELALLAARADPAEELDRLEAHVAETRRSLAAGGACGRRLDFLMQEFNREANTLSSKSVSTQITRAALEMKVLIEQMREQVQNIE